MSELNEQTYAALITLSIPEKGESTTVSVMLLPADVVPLEGNAKLLRDCTLGDLQAYAQELEKEVWDAYEAISLLDLEANDNVGVEVTLGIEDDESVGYWDQQILLLPQGETTSEEVEQLPEDVQEVVDEEVEKHPFQIDQSTLPPNVDVVEDYELEDDPPDVAVSETELVFPEIEEEIADPDHYEPSPEQFEEVPDIIPSKARVRVAGERLPIGHPTWAAVDILIDEPALRATQAHALSSLQREVAGVLVGRRPEKQPDGRYLVHIFDTIVARHTVMQGASVTYTPESWRYLNDTLAERYPDETAVMVGWYHTHPGFGIFLSGMDLFIHQNFFTQIWHVAMVLDPRARTSGFFCWDRGKSRVSRCDFAWPKWAAKSW